MLAYGIKIYFTDGDWNYYYGTFDGSTTCGKTECRIRCFETQSEAWEEVHRIERNWDSIEDSYGNVKHIDHCVLVKCNY